MRSLEQPFDAIAREQFILQFYQLVDPLDGHTENSTEKRNPGSLSVDVVDPDVVQVDWSVGGRTFAGLGETLTFDFDDLGFGTYTVRARAYDDTDWVRGDRTALEQTVTWTVINDTRLYGGSLNDTLVGNGLANDIQGRDGSDVLFGGAGVDTLRGGVGDDTYHVDDPADVVTEDPGEGSDTIRASISYTQPANVENLILEGSANLSGTGNALANIMTGTAGDNSLVGGGGDDRISGAGGGDVLDGGDGRDAVSGGAGSDRVFGGAGLDTVRGGASNDVVMGGAGSDRVFGGAGNDRLTGGRGRDIETGGSGRDRFIFDDRDTGASRKTADYILDFRGGFGDRLDLRLIDANVKARGDQKFAFIGEADFTKVGQVRYEHTRTDTWILLNTDADASAEAVIRLKVVFDVSDGWLFL
jgi:Ca2+-binding RTX toxin-like protein